MSLSSEEAKAVYWHQDLPPLDAEVMQEHVIEATSDRVPGVIERHGDLWQHCYVVLWKLQGSGSSRKSSAWVDTMHV